MLCRVQGVEVVGADAFSCKALGFELRVWDV